MLTRSSTRRWSSDPRLPLLGLAAVVGLTVAAYARFLSTGFAASDSLPLIENSRLGSLEAVPRLFTTPVLTGTTFVVDEVVYRPFVSLTFGLDYLLWGPTAVGYHLSNLALHVVTVAAVWLLFSNLGLSRWSSVLGAAVFAFHPVVLATVPVIGRRDSIVPVTAIVIAAWLLLLAETSPRRRRRFLLLGVSLVLAALAMLSKESAFVGVGLLPILLAGRAWGSAQGLRGTWRSAFLAWPFVVLAVVLFGLRLLVLRGLGGMDSADLGFVDVYRYGTLLGSYTRDLFWAFAGLRPPTRDAWLRVAGALVVGLALSLVCLPRRQAALAAVGCVWIIAFGVFTAVFKIATLGWLAYFALVGVALVIAAGAEGAVRQLRVGAHRRDRWLRVLGDVSLAGLLIGLLTYALGSLWASALFRDYPQWQVAGDVESRYMQALEACVAAYPEVSYVSLQRVPEAFDDGRPETDMLGVTLIQQYTAEAALRQAFPDRALEIHVGSVDTLHAGPDALKFSCVRQAHGVELNAQY
ncbi:MAG TPA: hypothetical protein VF937_01185 [Chloroflexota bacterium]